MKSLVLTDRRLEWYFKIRFPQMNLENQIHQRFQTSAAGKHLNPYQGLKLNCGSQHDRDLNARENT